MLRKASLLAIVLAIAGSATASFGQPAEGLHQSEQLAMSDTLQYSLENNPANEVAQWVNPDTGHSGSVVPLQTYTNEAGQPCREFVTTIVIGGREEQGFGTACRQADGSWQIVADSNDGVQDPPPQTDVYVVSPPASYAYGYYPYYPSAYYYYPSSFYYPFNIYLSFSYIYRSGHLHYGLYYLDGPRFRYRHPVHIRSRVYMGSRFFERHRWYYRPTEHYRHRVSVPAPAHRERYDRRRTYHRQEPVRQAPRRSPELRQPVQRREPNIYRSPERQQRSEQHRTSYRRPVIAPDQAGTDRHYRTPVRQQNQGSRQSGIEQRQQGFKAERRSPRTDQRSPSAGQERATRQAERYVNRTRQPGSGSQPGVFGARQRSR